jgi:protein disulfide-isomerase
MAASDKPTQQEIPQMKLIIVTLAAFAVATTTFAADPAPTKPQAPKPLWTTDHGAAMKQAKDENKIVLLNFTGSDWCGWCIRLKNEVFNTADFKTFAEKNLVCVEVDFPRGKPQTPELKAQNRALQAKYQIRGYPTIVVLDSDGKHLGNLGYQQGGPKVWLNSLKQIMAKRTTASAK